MSLPGKDLSMNSKKSNNQKSKAILKKARNGRKSSCQAKNCLKKSNNIGNAKKILPEHQPFVWQWLAEGRTYQKTADLLKEEFNIQITFNGVYDYQKRHDEEWKEYLGKIKEVRLANAKARILERQRIGNKLRDKIIEILDMPPRFWKDLNVALLIREFNSLLEQIQDEAGDKITKLKGEGFDSHQHFYLGDKLVNEIADQAVSEETGPEIRVSGDRFKEN